MARDRATPGGRPRVMGSVPSCPTGKKGSAAGTSALVAPETGWRMSKEGLGLEGRLKGPSEN